MHSLWLVVPFMDRRPIFEIGQKSGLGLSKNLIKASNPENGSPFSSKGSLNHGTVLFCICGGDGIGISSLLGFSSRLSVRIDLDGWDLFVRNVCWFKWLLNLFCELTFKLIEDDNQVGSIFTFSIALLDTWGKCEWLVAFNNGCVFCLQHSQ